MSSVPLPASAVTGEHEASALAGQSMVDALIGVEKQDASLGRSLIEGGFGTSVASSGITYREYALRTLCILATLGDCSDQMAIYTEAALQHGATEYEILSVIDQVTQYAGNPRAVNALRVVEPKVKALPSHLAVKEYTVNLSDHETMVVDSGGCTTPMLLIHALCMDRQMFQQLMPRIYKQDPRVRMISYDMRGHGHARGAPACTGLEQLVADVILLMDRLGIAEVDVIGASFGGAVAQELAVMHPDRVRALCPMATGPQGNPELLSRATRSEAGEMDVLSTEGIMRWFLPNTIANNAWFIRYARAKLDHVNIYEWASSWRAMSKLDVLAQIGSLDCPVLVLAGGKDPSGTPERMKQIHQAFVDVGKKNSEYVELENGTHMMAMDTPQEVADVLVTWRRKIDAAEG